MKSSEHVPKVLLEGTVSEYWDLGLSYNFMSKYG